MSHGLDLDALRDQLLAALWRRGPCPARELYEALGISQPSFSRLVGGLEGVIELGRARRTRYAALRSIEGLQIPIRVYDTPLRTAHRQHRHARRRP